MKSNNIHYERLQELANAYDAVLSYNKIWEDFDNKVQSDFDEIVDIMLQSRMSQAKRQHDETVDEEQSGENEDTESAASENFIIPHPDLDSPYPRNYRSRVTDECDHPLGIKAFNEQLEWSLNECKRLSRESAEKRGKELFEYSYKGFGLLKKYIESNVINDEDEDKSDLNYLISAMNRCFCTFLERRDKYGAHTENSIEYIEDGVSLKSRRLINKRDKGEDIDFDTMIDLACYALMWLSMVYVDDE